MDLSFLTEADAIMLEMEKAKRALEAAKVNFENAKRNYDEWLSRADEVGVPRAKLKKLAEDRISLLFDSGLIDFLEKRNDAPVVKKPRKPKRAPEEVEEQTPPTDLSEDSAPEISTT